MNEKKEIRNPFKGTQQFLRKDFGELFGRSEDLIKMKDRIFSDRTTLLFASSGVGKTSFLNASVIPSLEEIYEIFYFKYWATNDIYEEIKNSFLYQFPNYKQKLNKKSLKNLKMILDDVFNDKRLLIVFDQFEEAFQHHQYQKYFYEFLQDIANCINENDGKIKFVFSMREEFLGDLSAFDNLIPDLFNNYYRLKYPNLEQSKRIIKDTSLLVQNVDIDEPKLNLLIDDLSKIDLPGFSVSSSNDDQGIIGKPFITPTYLQIICHRLWKEFSENVKTSTNKFLNNYKSQQSITIIKKFALLILDHLSFRDKKRFSKMLNFFMTTRGSKLFITLDSLSKHLGQNSEKIENTLNKLITDQGRLFHRSDRADKSTWYGIQHDVFIPILKEWNEKFRRQKFIIYSSILVVLCAIVILISFNTYDSFKEYQLETKIKTSLEQFNETQSIASLNQLENNFKLFEDFSADSDKVSSYDATITKRKNEFQIGIKKKETELFYAIEEGDYEAVSSMHQELSRAISDTSNKINLEKRIKDKLKDKAIYDVIQLKDSLGYSEVMEYIDKLKDANIEINDLNLLVLGLRGSLKKNIKRLEAERQNLEVDLDDLNVQQQELIYTIQDEREQVQSELLNIYSLVSNDIEIISPPSGRIKRNSITHPLHLKFKINPIYDKASILINKKVIKNDSTSIFIKNSKADTILLNAEIQLNDTSIFKDIYLFVDDSPPLIESFNISFKSGTKWNKNPGSKLLLGNIWKVDVITDEPVKYCNIVTSVWDNLRNTYDQQSSYYPKISKNDNIFSTIIHDGENYYDYFPDSRKVKIEVRFEDLLGHWNKSILFEGYIPANFRRIPKNISIMDIRSDIINLGFFDKIHRDFSQAGFFNDFKMTNKNGFNEIIDLRSGLVWLSGKIIDNIQFNVAASEIESMNKSNINGYTNWRIPTIQEAYSLLESKKNKNNQFLSNDFPSINHIWICDKLNPMNMPFGLSFEGGTFSQGLNDYSLIAVRNIDSRDIDN